MIFTPWLNGERTPVDDHTIRGGWNNLSLTTDRADLVRSVFEGVAYNSRWLLDTVEKFIKRPLDGLNFIGGGARSDLWCQMHADVCDRVIRRVAEPQHANARGAAFVAWLALGRQSLDELNRAVTIEREFHPDPDGRAAYAPLYKEFLKLYKAHKADPRPPQRSEHRASLGSWRSRRGLDRRGSTSSCWVAPACSVAGSWRRSCGLMALALRGHRMDDARDVRFKLRHAAGAGVGAQPAWILVGHRSSIVTLVLALSISGLPERARFTASRPCLDRYVEERIARELGPTRSETGQGDPSSAATGSPMRTARAMQSSSPSRPQASSTPLAWPICRTARFRNWQTAISNPEFRSLGHGWYTWTGSF